MLTLLQKEGFPDYIINSKREIETLHFLKYSLFLCAKHGEHKLLREICQLMRDHLSNESIKEILHFKSQDGLFSKPLLNYCNENVDLESCVEILKMEKQVQCNLNNGLHELRSQNPSGPMTNWILKTYSQLYPVSKAPWILLIIAMVTVFIELGCLSYGSAIYDIYSDVQVYSEYSNYNASVFNTGFFPKCSKDDLYDSDGTHSTYETASIVTLWVLIGSAFMYVINIILADIPQVVDVHGCICGMSFTLPWLGRFINKCVMLLFLPIFHIINSIKLLVSNKKAVLQDKEDKFKVVLAVLKLWEVGLENNVQLIISLWACRHFTPCLLKNGNIYVLENGFQGLGNILSFGNIEADFIQKLLGKLFMALLSTLFSLALMKCDKPGMNIGEKLIKALLLFAAYLFQTFSRLCGLLGLIYLNEGNLKYYLSFGLHSVLTLAILVLFETSRNKCNGCKVPMYIVLRALSSFFILPSDLNKEGEIYTFVSQTLYQILFFVENLVMVVIMIQNPDLYPSGIKENLNTSYLIYILVGSWLVSVLLQVCSF